LHLERPRPKRVAVKVALDGEADDDLAGLLTDLAELERRAVRRPSRSRNTINPAEVVIGGECGRRPRSAR
jgi:hypothetical protein